MDFSDLNTLGRQRKPFLFISDFKAQKIEVILLEDLEKEDVEFSINENYHYVEHSHYLKTDPIEFQNYQEKFKRVIDKIESG
ncbi:MAG: aminodeoxychorismate synthase component I, partial [Campylobacterota bacterium]